MRSIPASMTWEMLARGRWHILFATLGSIAFPALILIALKQDGALNVDDPATRMMHTIFALLGITWCGGALIQSHGNIAKLFSFPISTAELVAWRLLPSMAIITVQMALITAALNALFNLNWPIWGPALFAAAAFAAVEATLWLTENSTVWIAVAIGVVGGLLGLWFKTRYGGIASQPERYWQYVTPSEVITMLAISAASYWVAVKAVARLRCGTPPFSLGIIDRLTRYLESHTTFKTAPKTAFESQCHYEWQRKGWLMPAAVLLIVVGGVIGWFFMSRDPEALIIMFICIGGGFSLLGVFAGMAFGNTGSNDANYGIATFLATRPISDGDLTRAILKMAAASVVLSWLIWAVSFAIACLCLVVTGASRPVAQLEGVSWLVYASTLFGPWVVTGVVASVGFFGRLGAILITLTAFFGCIIAFALLNNLISPELKATLRQMVLFIGPAIVLVASPLFFAAAKRNQLISSTIGFGSAIFWSVGVASVLLFWPSALPLTFTAILLSMAAVALVVVPLAAAPLALSANRHR